MPSPLRDLLAGRIGGRRAVETVAAHRTFADVILPPRIRAALDEALSLVHSHELIFTQWGLGERHSSGLGLAFNFAGPPGTGKTICAEAITTVLGKKLLSVRSGIRAPHPYAREIRDAGSRRARADMESTVPPGEDTAGS